MPHPLDSARERLRRAEENIESLRREISDFLAPVPAVTMDVDFPTRNPIITDENRGTYDELTQFIMTQSVKPRFSVLAGEIIHHLRAAFDHLAWQLSSPVLQANSPYQIEFPVFDVRPRPCGKCGGANQNKLCRYCRKVEGITSPTARTRIESLQPYKGANPSRHPLWLIHDMDRIDKHRELVLTVHIMRVNVQANALFTGTGQQLPWEVRPRNVRLTGPPQVDVKLKMAADVTFREFSGRDDDPIIPTLHNLRCFAVDSIDSFASEFP